MPPWSRGASIVYARAWLVVLRVAGDGATVSE